MRSYLILKLLAIHLAVIGFVMIIVWLSIDTLAAGYFVTLMEKYNISPEPAHAMFISAVHRYLVWAFVAAMALAVVLSFVLMRKVLAPLTRMNTTTRQIAAGDFSARVPVNTRDEVGYLAKAFNRMAESLEEIESLRRTLMIDVAHELRTPLTNIRGYLEALNDRVLPLSDKTLSLLQDETLRLVQLVEDVLQLARADASHGKLKLERADLKEMIDTTLKSFSREISQKSVTVNVHMPEKILTVSLDKDRIARVIRNLTDNAVRYAPEKDSIQIRMESNPLKVRVEFINNGGDLISEDLPFIFERFYRGEKSRSRKHGGAGIGLAIVKELVEAHQGTVGAELTNGRFRIWFELPKNPLYPKS
jgi:two-component system sensor histidine kinase BaeS